MRPLVNAGILFICKPVLTVKQLLVDSSFSVHPSYWLPNLNTIVKTRTGTMGRRRFGVASDKCYRS